MWSTAQSTLLAKLWWQMQFNSSNEIDRLHFLTKQLTQELCNLKNIIDGIINAFSSTPDKALDI